ncbi:MAG TPA: 50S ribosomal protein L19 [Mariniflexile sp.]
MALFAIHGNTKFGVGDTIRVSQIIKEGEKSRKQVFEGIVTKIKGKQDTKSFTVRRIGAQNIGIERIYPLASPMIDSIDVSRAGTAGVKRAKLTYIRTKPRREIEKIYSRARNRLQAKKAHQAKNTSKSSK